MKDKDQNKSIIPSTIAFVAIVVILFGILLVVLIPVVDNTFFLKSTKIITINEKAERIGDLNQIVFDTDHIIYHVTDKNIFNTLEPGKTYNITFLNDTYSLDGYYYKIIGINGETP
jgi:hypothetical protein